MSILKFVPHNARNLVDMCEYVLNPTKTSPDLVLGLGINARHALEEMMFAEFVWEDGENQPSYQHVILSFDRNVKTSLPLDTIKEIAWQIGKLFYTEHQVLAAIHQNTPNIHCHYIICSINLFSGNQYRQQRSLYSYKQDINKILVRYGLLPIHCFSGSIAYKEDSPCL